MSDQQGQEQGDVAGFGLGGEEAGMPRERGDKARSTVEKLFSMLDDYIDHVERNEPDGKKRAAYARSLIELAKNAALFSVLHKERLADKALKDKVTSLEVQYLSAAQARQDARVKMADIGKQILAHGGKLPKLPTGWGRPSEGPAGGGPCGGGCGDGCGPGGRFSIADAEIQRQRQERADKAANFVFKSVEYAKTHSVNNMQDVAEVRRLWEQDFAEYANVAAPMGQDIGGSLFNEKLYLERMISGFLAQSKEAWNALTTWRVRLIARGAYMPSEQILAAIRPSATILERYEENVFRAEEDRALERYLSCDLIVSGGALAGLLEALHPILEPLRAQQKDPILGVEFLGFLAQPF